MWYGCDGFYFGVDLEYGVCGYFVFGVFGVVGFVGDVVGGGEEFVVCG